MFRNFFTLNFPNTSRAIWSTFLVLLLEELSLRVFAPALQVCQLLAAVFVRRLFCQWADISCSSQRRTFICVLTWSAESSIRRIPCYCLIFSAVERVVKMLTTELRTGQSRTEPDKLGARRRSDTEIVLHVDLFVIHDIMSLINSGNDNGHVRCTPPFSFSFFNHFIRVVTIHRTSFGRKIFTFSTVRGNLIIWFSFITSVCSSKQSLWISFCNGDVLCSLWGSN